MSFYFIPIVLVGCTVWYGLSNGSAYHAPEGCLFAPIESYDPFLNMDYYAPGFHRATFVTRNDISESMVSTFKNDLPFAEITIPASGIGMPLTSSIELGSSIF
jgi:hypothetical protein